MSLSDWMSDADYEWRQLMESGAVRHFDVGPYLLRYSDKATVLPSELKN